jgi:hypothetical protein
LKLVRRWPWLRRIPAYLVGVGVRPEHVRVPEMVSERVARPRDHAEAPH